MTDNSITSAEDGSQVHIVGYKGVVLVPHYHERWHRVIMLAYRMAAQAIQANHGPVESVREAQCFQRIRLIRALKPTNREARKYFARYQLEQM